MLGLLTLLAVGLAIAWAGVVVAVHRTLTHPPRRTYASAVARGRAGDPGELDPPIPFQSWTFTSRGLRLPVWDLPGESPDGPVAVVSHGWGDSRIGVLQRLALLRPSCSKIVAWDLPGHGEAPGLCRLGAVEPDDLTALIESLVPANGTRQANNGPRILLYGWSMGAGVSLVAASGLPARGIRLVGVIAEAPYRLPATPASRVLAAMRWPWRLVLMPALMLASMGARPLRRRSEFDRAEWARRLPCPLLVLHGERDEVCPVEDGVAIAEAARAGGRGGSIEVFEAAFHNDLWQSEDRLARGEAAVRVFLAGSGTRPPG